MNNGIARTISANAEGTSAGTVKGGDSPLIGRRREKSTTAQT